MEGGVASWLRRRLTYLWLRVRATRGVYQFFDTPSDSFLLLFRAVSRALMVLNYSHWVLLGQELA